MSDLLSPLLVTMMDEAHAYICFCALMQRLKTNFLIDGVSMTKKFQHLTDGLLYYDPELFTYLKLNQADDLLFCYRWLLLEMKREFDFDDCFKVLETLWSSLPPNFPSRSNGLKLFEVQFSVKEPEKITKSPMSYLTTANMASTKSLISTPKKQETAYSKVASLRRQTSGLSAAPSSRLTGISERRQAQSTSNEKDSRPMRIQSIGSADSSVKKTINPTPESSEGAAKNKRLVKSNSWVNAGSSKITLNRVSESQTGGKKIKDLKDFSKLTSKTNSDKPHSNGTKEKENGTRKISKTVESEIEVNGEREELLSEDDDFSDDAFHNDSVDDDEVVGYSNFNSASKMKLSGISGSLTGLTLVCEKLPEPTEFGDGNPFLIFLCIACLLQHRNHIMQQQLDYQEIAMYFDKMVRKHNVEKTLFIARKLFAEYLNSDWGVTNETESQTDNSLKDSKTVSTENHGDGRC